MRSVCECVCIHTQITVVKNPDSHALLLTVTDGVDERTAHIAALQVGVYPCLRGLLAFFLQSADLVLAVSHWIPFPNSQDVFPDPRGAQKRFCIVFSHKTRMTFESNACEEIIRDLKEFMKLSNSV
jgi:hypothetical protein